MDVHPLYQRFIETANALATAQQAHNEAKAALLAAMPADGVEVSTVEAHAPIIRRNGDQIEVVTHPFLGTTPAA